MSRSKTAVLGLTALLGLTTVSPVLADASTEAFIAGTQRAIATLDKMQALFAQIDQRKQSQAAAAASAAAPNQPEKPQ